MTAPVVDPATFGQIPIALAKSPAREAVAGRALVDEIESGRSGFEGGETLSIGIVLWPEFPLLSLAGLVDALRHAADLGDNSQKLRCSWTVMGPAADTQVRASCGVGVATDSAFLDPRRFHYVAVIGGLLRSMDAAPAANRAYLARVVASGVPLVGICTGTFVLAREGYLDGRRACLHAYHHAEFRDHFPRTHAIVNADFVDDGDRLSCAGGISIIALATHLIERHCGADRATKSIHQMSVTNKADASTVSVSQAIGYTRVADPRLRQAVFLLERSLLQPLSTGWIAEKVGVSPRHLTRLFRKELGRSPTGYVRLARLRYGRWLLQNSSETVTEIALRLGFSDCSHFDRQFRREFGTSPGDVRVR